MSGWSPGSGSFLPGQFAKLFEEVLDTVDFVFDKGIDWRAFVLTLDRLKVEAGEDGAAIAVRSIENKDGVFVVRLEVPAGMDREAVHEKTTAWYEAELERLGRDYRGKLRAKNKDIKSGKAELERARQDNANLWSVINKLADRPAHMTIRTEATAMTRRDSISVGNVTNSNLNIQSTLERVTQTVGTLPGPDEAARERLADLLRRLDETLKQAPRDKAEEAAAVAELAADLVRQAKADRPNRSLLAITAKGLKDAAALLGGAVPAALVIAKELIEYFEL